MIVRVLTARVVPRHAARFNELLRGQLAELREQPGLVYVKLARRFDDDGDQEVVLFEEWRTPSDLWRWTRGRLSQPRLLPGTEELIDNLTITHYEALDLDPAELERVVFSSGGPSGLPKDWRASVAGADRGAIVDRADGASADGTSPAGGVSATDPEPKLASRPDPQRAPESSG